MRPLGFMHSYPVLLGSKLTKQKIHKSRKQLQELFFIFCFVVFITLVYFFSVLVIFLDNSITPGKLKTRKPNNPGKLQFETKKHMITNILTLKFM